MKRLAALALLALSAFAGTLLPATASAHERREVGNYVVVVGFLREPAYVEQMNAALINVFKKDGTAVEGLEKTLKVEVTTANQSRTFDLHRDPAKPGSYTAEFIPTRTGNYTFRFFGVIESQQFNESFQSGPNRFDEVTTAEAVQFPVKVPSTGELAAQVQAAGGNTGTTPAPSGPTNADLERALDRADSARTMAIGFGAAGIVAGLAGLAVAAMALRSRSGGAATTTRPGNRSEPV